MAVPTLLTPGKIKLSPKIVVDPKIVPINYITQWVRSRMTEFTSRETTAADRVLCINSGTGSGKSTIIPVELFRLIRSSREPPTAPYEGKSLICTQPRVLTAMTLAADISSRPWNPDIIMGYTTGYQTGDFQLRPPKGLIYTTIGVLAVQLKMWTDEEVMAAYRFIVFDEAHERSLESDLTLYLLCEFYKRNSTNPRLPFLIVASATFDPLKYATYFGLGEENVIYVEGKTYPIEIRWPTFPITDTSNFAIDSANTAIHIHETYLEDGYDKSDIMIFIPGAVGAQTVMMQLQKKLREYATSNPDMPSFTIININRATLTDQEDDYELMMGKKENLPPVNGKHPMRRIIVANVVAETGITIDTLKYVIDCGWSKTMEVYNPHGLEGLISKPAAISRIKQRMGRSGRLFPGVYYPMYTEEVYNMLDVQQLPDIVTNGAKDVLLVLMREQQKNKAQMGKKAEFKLEDLRLIDQPPADIYLAANSTASCLGFVSTNAPLPNKWPFEISELQESKEFGYGLTPLGYMACKSQRTSMNCVKVAMAAYLYDVSMEDLITAISICGNSVDDLIKAGKGTPFPLDAAALTASLPDYLLSFSGTGQKKEYIPQPITEDNAFYYRAKILICDNFIESILIFHAFEKKLAANSLGEIKDWCTKTKVSYKDLCTLSARRNEVIGDLINVGLDPFRGSHYKIAETPKEDFIDRLCSIKKCLYEGFKMNLLTYSKTDHCYYTPQNIKIKIPYLVGDKMLKNIKATVTDLEDDTIIDPPKYLIADKFYLEPKRQGPNSHIYIAVAKLVSVLDGYVEVDAEFTAPRHFK